MKNCSAYRPEGLPARRAEAAGSRHQRTFAFGWFIGGAFARGLLLAVTYRLGITSLAVGAGFGCRFRLGDAAAQARFVSAQFAELLLAFLNGGFEAGERLFTLVARLLKLGLLRFLLVNQRLLLALFLSR